MKPTICKLTFAPSLMQGLLLGLLLGSGIARADDLLGVYNQAKTNDPVWRSAQAARTVGTELGVQGRAQLLPSVNFAASTSQTRQDVTMGTGSENRYKYDTDTYDIQLTQPLYRKRAYAGYAQGRALAQQAEEDFTSARQDLILRTAHAYFTALNARDVLEFARAEKTSVDRLRSLSQRHFSVGTASLVDVHEAQAAYDAVTAQEIAAQNDLDVRQEALRVLTNTAPGDLARLDRSIDLRAPEPADINKWVDMVQESPQVRSTELSVQAARQELEKSRGISYPTLDLQAGRSYNDAGGSVQGFAMKTVTNQVGIVLQVPIYQGGLGTSIVRESAARLDQAEQGLESVKRQSAQQVRQLYLGVINGVARVKALEQGQVSSQRALESTLLGYERGLRSNIDVISAQRESFRTRRDLAQARYDYLLARLQLKAAVGRLSEEDLQEINGFLVGS